MTHFVERDDCAMCGRSTVDGVCLTCGKAPDDCDCPDVWSEAEDEC